MKIKIIRKKKDKSSFYSNLGPVNIQTSTYICTNRIQEHGQLIILSVIVYKFTRVMSLSKEFVPTKAVFGLRNW